MATHAHMQLTLMFAPGLGAPGLSKAALRETDRQTVGSACVREQRHACVLVITVAAHGNFKYDHV